MTYRKAGLQASLPSHFATDPGGTRESGQKRLQTLLSREAVHPKFWRNRMHKTDSSTNNPRLQANVVNTTLIFSTVRGRLGDAESQTITAQTLCEIAFDLIDAIVITDEATDQAINRLDALFKSAYRAAITTQELISLASLAIEEVEGVQ